MPTCTLSLHASREQLTWILPEQILPNLAVEEEDNGKG
jgi:hypothetical protein